MFVIKKVQKCTACVKVNLKKMAKEANAVYKLDKLVLVNCDIFEAYLETFRTGI